MAHKPVLIAIQKEWSLGVQITTSISYKRRFNSKFAVLFVHFQIRCTIRSFPNSLYYSFISKLAFHNEVSLYYSLISKFVVLFVNFQIRCTIR